MCIASGSDRLRSCVGGCRRLGHPRSKQCVPELYLDRYGDGDVLQVEPTTVLVPSTAVLNGGLDAWRVLYKSVGARGRSIAVNAVVMSPHATWADPGSRPLVSFAVGTRGLADRCAPSHSLAHGTDSDAPASGALLDRGWAVVVTDYEGIGTPDAPPYLNRLSQGHAVLDAARTAQRVGALGLDPRGPVGLYGYSQGGVGSAAAAELATVYAPN